VITPQQHIHCIKHVFALDAQELNSSIKIRMCTNLLNWDYQTIGSVLPMLLNLDPRLAMQFEPSCKLENRCCTTDRVLRVKRPIVERVEVREELFSRQAKPIWV